MANEGGLEIVESAGPEPLVEGDPLVRFGERPGLDAAAVRATLDGTPEQSCAFQDFHMLCCGRERHGERFGKFANASFTLCQPTQHGATCGISQRAEDAIQDGRSLFNHMDEYNPPPALFNHPVEEMAA